MDSLSITLNLSYINGSAGTISGDDGIKFINENNGNIIKY